MSQSRLIELSYYDPSAQVSLTAYADTVVLDHNSKGGEHAAHCHILRMVSHYTLLFFSRPYLMSHSFWLRST